jgi:hypothetical protein
MSLTAYYDLNVSGLRFVDIARGLTNRSSGRVGG